MIDDGQYCTASHGELPISLSNRNATVVSDRVVCENDRTVTEQLYSGVG
jgi:hypothetical protein